MTDSETLARLIYRSFVLAQPGLMEGLDARVPFPAAMELYAKTRIRELIEEGKLELAPESDEEPPAPEPSAPEPELADTHTHTPQGAMTAKALRPTPSPEKDRARKERSLST